MTSIRSTLGATWALLGGVLLLMIGNGLQSTLLGVRSTLEGFDTLAIGIIMASYYAGFLIGCRATFMALANVGHIRVFAAFASLASAAVLFHSLWLNPVSWTVMRFITGFCMAGLFVVSESWLNDRATNATRGTIMSAYMVVATGGTAIGQLLLNVASPASFKLFVVASAVVSVSLVPMALSAQSSPPIPEIEPMTLREMRSTVQTGLIAIFLAGLAGGTIGGLAAVHATQVGMSTSQISVFMSAILVGAVVFQLPLGAASDRLPRRLVMLATSVVGVGLALAGLVAPETGWIPTLIILGIGGVSFPLYSLSVAYSNDWIPDGKRAGAATLLIMTNGIGATVGPIVGAMAMQWSVSGFFWTLAGSFSLMVAFLTYRIVVEPPVPVSEQSRFAPITQRSTAVLYPQHDPLPGGS